MQTVDASKAIRRADDVPGPPQGNWTYASYCSTPNDGRRYQIVNGVLYVTPSPGAQHQFVAGMIYAALLHHVLGNGLGEVMNAPMDVRLADDTIFQPDVLVVLAAHLDRITEPYVDGAPDLVVEVASRSTTRFDATKKRRAYEAAGIPEYWIVDPGKQTLELLVLENEKYRSRGQFSGADHIPSTVVPTFAGTVGSFFTRSIR